MKKFIIGALFLYGCGIQGPQGSQGIAGQIGTPGTKIWTVQFCPNLVGAYPSSFPESGLCVNGDIFAVFWDGHNAWQAQLYPGNYRTTETGAVCNFMVYDGCMVVPQ